MEAAIAALREHQPARIIVAAPVGAPETCARLTPLADEVVCLRTPSPFYAVGQWYERFDQTTDEEVTEFLRRASIAWPVARARGWPSSSANDPTRT